MVRRLMVALVAVVFFGSCALAEEIKGTIEKINTKSGDLTLKVGDKTQTFVVTYMAKVFDKADKEQTGKKRLAIFAVNAEVTVTTEKKDDKEVVTKLKLNK